LLDQHPLIQLLSAQPSHVLVESTPSDDKNQTSPEWPYLSPRIKISVQCSAQWFANHRQSRGERGTTRTGTQSDPSSVAHTWPTSSKFTRSRSQNSRSGATWTHRQYQRPFRGNTGHLDRQCASMIPNWKEPKHPRVYRIIGRCQVLTMTVNSSSVRWGTVG